MMTVCVACRIRGISPDQTDTDGKGVKEGLQVTHDLLRRMKQQKKAIGMLVLELG